MPFYLHIVWGSLHAARQSWVIETDTIWPKKPKIFILFKKFKKLPKKEKVKKLKKLSTSVQKLALYFIKAIFYLKFYISVFASVAINFATALSCPWEASTERGRQEPLLLDICTASVPADQAGQPALGLALKDHGCSLGFSAREGLFLNRAKGTSLSLFGFQLLKYT